MQLNGSLIREKRTERGWTQQQLADICGLSLRTIQRVELHGIASLETSKALASAFEIERAELEQVELEQVELNHNQPKVSSPAVPMWLLAMTFLTGLLTGMVAIKLLT